MPNGLVLERFYRVLFFEPLGHNHMIENWNAGRYYGFHIVRHPHWDGIWNQTRSTNWWDYPLTYSVGFYAWEARLAYVAALQAHGDLANWSDDEDRNARLIVGVPAFRCPLGAVRYAENAEAIAPPLIATFDGTFVWYLPEEADTGVQALVIQRIGDPISVAEFRETHRIQPPPHEGSGEFELPYSEY
jgi:hypothetical protein